MAYEVVWEESGLYRNFSGKISGDEILKSNFELHLDTRFMAINYIVNDFSDVTEYSIEPIHTKIYADTDEMISNSKGELKIAIVVTHASLIDIANAYKQQMIGKLFECEIFKNVVDARVWVSD